jgi:hypothetical protein
MKEAQQRRWAKIRGESESPASSTPEPPRAQADAKKVGEVAIVAALKKRWATKKAEVAKAKPAAANEDRSKETRTDPTGKKCNSIARVIQRSSMGKISSV